MDKKEFLKLGIKDRVKYFNAKIKEMGSYSKVCKELGISVSLSGTFKKHGWILSGDEFIYDESLDKEINNGTTKVENTDINIPGQETLFDKTDNLQNHTSSISQSERSSDITINTESSHNCLNYKTATSLENEPDSMEPTNMKVEDSIKIPSSNENDHIYLAGLNNNQTLNEVGIPKNENRENTMDDTIIKKSGRPSKPGRRKYSLNLNIADFKQLQIHCILNDLSPSDVVGDLIKDFLTKEISNEFKEK